MGIYNPSKQGLFQPKARVFASLPRRPFLPRGSCECPGKTRSAKLRNALGTNQESLEANHHGFAGAWKTLGIRTIFFRQTGGWFQGFPVDGH